MGRSGYPAVYNKEHIQQIVHGYIGVNKFILPLPAIPVVIDNTAAVLPSMPTMHRMPDSHIKDFGLDAIEVANFLSDMPKLPNLLNVDMSTNLAAVITDDLGRKYNFTTASRVLYCNDSIDAQATLMSSAIPLPDDCLDLAISSVKLSLGEKDPGTVFIYLKDKFVDVYEFTT